MSTTITTTESDVLERNWEFSPVHSSAGFSVKYLVATFSGAFDESVARLENGKLSGEVDVRTIRVKDENLAAHLMAPDFFDADQHPQISFESNRIEIDGDQVELDGELTMKGVTKPIRANGTFNGPTEDFMGKTRLGFVLETTVDRTAYGVDWNADLPRGGKALSNEVTLKVELEFAAGE